MKTVIGQLIIFVSVCLSSSLAAEVFGPEGETQPLPTMSTQLENNNVLSTSAIHEPTSNVTTKETFFGKLKRSVKRMFHVDLNDPKVRTYIKKTLIYSSILYVLYRIHLMCSVYYI
uniref:RxLR effector protein n=1 Tax=Clastoptera arizonana TaxID=38151 RepID=A0A1B6DWF5_9HEMI